MAEGVKIRDRIKSLRRVKASELLPNPKNWRRHPDAQVDALRGVLEEVGIADTLLVRETPDGLMLIDGHLRADLDPDTKWPVLVLDVTEAEADKIMATHDPLAAMAEADEQKLGELLASLETDSEALEAMLSELAEENGIDLFEVGPEELQDPEAQLDRAEELQEKWKVKPGQLWEVVGKRTHRVLCGDSTDKADVERATNNKHMSLCLTDPPYGVGLQYASWDDTPENLKALILGFLPLARKISDIVLLTPGNGSQYGYPDPDWTLCWHIPAAVTLCKWGFASWQPILAYGKCPYLARGLGARPDMYSCNAASPKEHHPCPKPIEIWKWLIERGQPEPGNVYDPFLGSGTTMVAAEQLDRKCYGMEIEPKYVAVILERMTDLGCECKLNN